MSDQDKPGPVKTKDMNLQQYLSAMSFQPAQANKLERLFDLAKDWESLERGECGESGCCCHGECAKDLRDILG